MGNENKSQRDVQIPAQLYQAAQRLIAGTRFKSVDEFVSFALQQLTATDSASLNDKERKAIEERLRDLGYL